MNKTFSPMLALNLLIAVLCIISRGEANAQTTTNVAWGSINNFDCVNESGQECHGFEIDLEDCQSTDISYTYDYNHYGTPRISEDTTTVPGHTNVVIRYEAVWTNSGWSAYTAIPTNSIPPTQGHQFTDPTVNFGGEHFGVGFSTQPSAVNYYWLVDDGTGSGTLTYGGQVYVSTPAFTLYPVAGQIQAAIPPPAPVPIFYEFGDATWVKEIKTTTHTNNSIALRDLLTPDPEDTNSPSWQNGEPAEVEVEWTLMQPNNHGGTNELGGAPEGVTNHEEVVTRRWEFYDYVGPYDPETHEALADSVATNGVDGTGTYSNTAVVGDFLGAQMSAADVGSPLGLIDHLQDGEVGVDYPVRSVVIAPDTNFTVQTSGNLPDGLSFDPNTGHVSGMPTTPGQFIFTVSVWSTNHPLITKDYPIWIADVGVVLPPHYTVDVGVSSTNTGSAAGTGIYLNGDMATVMATPAVGYKFANWTEDGTVVSTSASYTFTNIINQSLVANFAVNPNPPMQVQSAGVGGFILTWPTNYVGFTLQQNYSVTANNWTTAAESVSVVGANYQTTVQTTNGPRYFRLRHP